MSRRRWAKFKASLSLIFSTKQDVSPRYTDNSVKVEGKDSVVNVVHNVIVRGTVEFIATLSQRIISGISYRDSDCALGCHPGTRINIFARIKSWLNGQGRAELILWITGPAVVGKRAIVQTIAEYLVSRKLPGASLFFSKSDGRNDSHLVFITIAYFFVKQHKRYRKFVIKSITNDPDLLNTRKMEEQFTKFIIEPLKEKVFGRGGKRWGILLDGLDEIEGDDAQRKIIQLVSSFVHNHRDAPFVWIISSRSESHIVNRFDDEDVRQRH